MIKEMSFRQKINDITIISVAFIFLIPLLLIEDPLKLMSISLIGISHILILRKINLKFLFLFLIMLILPTISIFITVILHGKIESGTSFLFLGKFKTTHEAVELAIFLSTRSVSLSLLSVVAVLGIHYDRFVLSLMQNLKLPVFIGYPLLAAFNAFLHLKKEFERIVMITKMRHQKIINPFLLLFPLLVSTIRYANQVGLSLESRGLVRDKSFLRTYKFNKWDYLLIFIFLIEAIFVSF